MRFVGHVFQVSRTVEDENARCRAYLPDVTRLEVLNKTRETFLDGNHALDIVQRLVFAHCVVVYTSFYVNSFFFSNELQGNQRLGFHAARVLSR